MTIIMLPSLLLTVVLANTPVQDPAASEAVTVCQQFVQVRLGKAEQPEEIKAQPVPKRAGGVADRWQGKRTRRSFVVCLSAAAGKALGIAQLLALGIAGTQFGLSATSRC